MRTNFEVLSQDEVEHNQEWTGDSITDYIGYEYPNDMIADLDQGINPKTIKSAIGPLAYRIVKVLSADG